MKAYTFRIYPNKNQEVKLNKTLATCRHLYNDSIAKRKRESEFNRLKRDFQVFPWGKLEWIDYYSQKRELTATKTDIQKEVHSQVLQDVIKRVDRRISLTAMDIPDSREEIDIIHLHFLNLDLISTIWN